MDIERLRALGKAVELVAKATHGPWAFMNEKFDDCLLAFGTDTLDHDAPPPWYSCWTSINPDDGRALIAAVNFIREHGSAVIAELGQEVGAVDFPPELKDRVDRLQAKASQNATAPAHTSEARDAARLDWLDANGFTAYRAIDPIDGLSGHCVVVHETQRPRRGNVHDTIRGAIDAAMGEAK